MHGSLYVCASVYRCICMEVYMYVRVFIGVVTQCRPENTHREFQPSNRNELLPKSPPFHAKVERVN